MTKMTFRNHKYSVYQAGNMFIAITQYGGRRVRAVAKCAPGDTFNADLGAQMAMARCAQKVEKIRLRNLKMHQKNWAEVIEMATQEWNDVSLKLSASELELELVEKNLENILEQAR